MALNFTENRDLLGYLFRLACLTRGRGQYSNQFPTEHYLDSLWRQYRHIQYDIRHVKFHLGIRPRITCVNWVWNGLAPDTSSYALKYMQSQRVDYNLGLMDVPIAGSRWSSLMRGILISGYHK